MIERLSDFGLANHSVISFPNLKAPFSVLLKYLSTSDKTIVFSSQQSSALLKASMSRKSSSVNDGQNKQAKASYW